MLLGACDYRFGVPLQVPMSGCALSQAGVRVTGGLVICKQLFAARRRRRRRRKILAFFVPKCGKSCKSCPREAVCERLQSPQMSSKCGRGR